MKQIEWVVFLNSKFWSRGFKSEDECVEYIKRMAATLGVPENNFEYREIAQEELDILDTVGYWVW